MNKRFAFYDFFLYITLLVFISQEGSILLEFMRHWIPVYSHSIVSSVLMGITIILGFNRGSKKNFWKLIQSKKLIIALLPIISFVLACYIDVLVNLLSSNVTMSPLAFLIRHLLFTLMFLQALSCGKFFTQLANPYYHIMGFILLMGAALFIVALSINDFQKHTLDVSFLRKSAEGNLGKSLYSMPYGLGLIISGQNLASVLGFKFFQFSSYFIEPQVFGFNMVPAFMLFLVKRHKNYKTWKQTLLVSMAIILLFWAHSLTTIFSLLCVGLVWLFCRNVLVSLLVIAFSVTSFLIILGYFEYLTESFSLIRKISPSSSQSSINTILQSFEGLSISGNGVFNAKVGEASINMSLVSLLFWVIFIVTVVINICNELLNDRNNMFAYVLIFLLISSLKGVSHAVPSITLIFTCLLFFAYKYTINSDLKLTHVGLKAPIQS